MYMPDGKLMSFLIKSRLILQNIDFEQKETLIELFVCVLRSTDKWMCNPVSVDCIVRRKININRRESTQKKILFKISL